MKRHEVLIPLSHDHHHALVVALRLKRGGPVSPQDDWPQDLAAQRTALQAFAREELIPHFEVEEELIFPLTQGSLETATAELRQEHARMRSLLTEIQHNAADDRLTEALLEFGKLLEAHVRKEERIFFPGVEEQLEAGALTIDAEALAQRHEEYRKRAACSR